MILAAEADGFEVCGALYDKHTTLLAAPWVRIMHVFLGLLANRQMIILQMVKGR